MGFFIDIVFLVLILVLFSRTRATKRILETLQSQLGGTIPPKEKASEADATTPLESSAAIPAEESSPDTTHLEHGRHPEPALVERFIEWMKEDWMLKIGALLLLIAFGWFVSYAFLHNWIGPIGRITLGILAGIGILSLGWFRIRAHAHQGGIFLILGSTVIFISVFAARELYDFFTPATALAVMFLSAAFVAFTSVKRRILALALGSLLLTGLAPLLTSAPETHYVGLFAYLFIAVLGTLWVVALTDWRILTPAALILVGLYSLPHITMPGAEVDILRMFAYGFAGLFFITNTLGFLSSARDDRKNISGGILTAALNGLFLLGWILSSAPAEWQSLIITAWAVVFAGGAFAIFRRRRWEIPFYTYGAVAAGMLAAATAVELSGAALTIAYIIEIALALVVIYYATENKAAAEKASLLFIVPAALSLESIAAPVWHNAILHKHFFVLLILAGALLGTGSYFIRKRQTASLQGSPAKTSGIGQFLVVVGSVYAYIIVWLSTHAALAVDIATMTSLVAYTIVGMTTNIYGKIHGQKGLQIYGGALLAFVIGRLLLVDVWQMELVGRITTFFLIGALLMSTAFIGRKNTDRRTRKDLSTDAGK